MPLDFFWLLVLRVVVADDDVVDEFYGVVDCLFVLRLLFLAASVMRSSIRLRI